MRVEIRLGRHFGQPHSSVAAGLACGRLFHDPGGFGDLPVNSSSVDTRRMMASCSINVMPGTMKLRSHRESALLSTQSFWASSARVIPALSRSDRRRVPNGSAAI